MTTLHITLIHKTGIPYCKTKVCITYPLFYATWRLFKLNKKTDHVMVRVNCSFKNMTWNIFAAGIPVRVWLLGCLGLAKNSPQVSIHPSNNLTLSVILSFFVSPSLHLQRDDLPVFTLSLGGGVVEMRHWRHQPGNWGDLCQIFIKKTGLALAQHLIRKVENKVMILSGENFLGKTTGLKSIFVHSRSKVFGSAEENIC